MTSPEIDLSEVHHALREDGLIPEDCLAVFIGGSVALGWDHARSDIDIYVVAASAWQGRANGLNTVALEPDTVPSFSTYLGERRAELRFWIDSQIDQLFEKATWDEFVDGDSLGRKISRNEAAFLSRLGESVTVTGDEWMKRRQQQLAECAFRSMWTLRALEEVDARVRDSIGMLESGDSHAAVLSAQMALSATTDALTLSRGQLSLDRKWRTRRLLTIDSPVLPFDLFWKLTTMRDFDPVCPGEWVYAVLEVCREVVLEIGI